MAISDRELGELTDFLNRTLERTVARGMPEMDEEVRWWIRKSQSEMALRKGWPPIDPGPKPPVIKP